LLETDSNLVPSTPRETAEPGPWRSAAQGETSAAASATSEERVGRAADDGIASLALSAVTPDGNHRANDPAGEHALWLAALWLAGALALAMRTAHRHAMVARFDRTARRESGPVPADCAATARRLAALLGAPRRLRLLQSPRLTAPVALGVFRPTIVLPDDFAARHGAAAREAMLAHELSHLAVGDPFWQLAADLVVAALWWQPLAWYARRRFRAACEWAADEASAVLPEGPAHLAAALVRLGRRMTAPVPLAWHAATGGVRSQLGQRVVRLLALRRAAIFPSRRLGARCAVLISLFAAPALAAGTASALPRHPPTEGETTMSTLYARSWRGSLGGAVLAAWILPAQAADDLSPDPSAPSADPPRYVALLENDDDDGDDKREEKEAKKHAKEGAKKETKDDDDGDDKREEKEAKKHAKEGAKKEAKDDDDGDDEREEKHAKEGLKKEAKHEKKVSKDAGDKERHADLDAARKDLETARDQLQHERTSLAEKMKAVERELALTKEGDKEGRQKLEAARADLHAYAARLKERYAELEAVQAKLAAAKKEGREKEERKEKVVAEKRPDRPEGDRKEGDKRPDPERRAPDRRPEGERREGDRRPDAAPELRRRLAHLRAAVENLRAAGMHDAADHLAREGERIAREHGGGDRERPDAPARPRPDGPQRPPLGERRPDAPPRPLSPPAVVEHHERAIAELREEVQQMRREMAELRELLRKSMAERR
jgi:beta-lactamase regulating signal transducer with metallopeptidase domain